MTIIVLCIIIFYASFTIIQGSKTVTIPINFNFNYSLRAITATGELGNPSITTILLMDLSKDSNIMLASHGYNSQSSNTIDVTNMIQMIDGNIKGTITYDYLSLGDYNQRLSFLLVNKRDMNFNGIHGFIALSRASTSFINQLINTGTITRRMMQFTLHHIIIGDFPENTMARCPLYYYGTNWACLFKGVFIGNITSGDVIIDQYANEIRKEEDKEQYAFFETFETDIIVPFDMIEFFKSYVLKEYLEKKECSLIVLVEKEFDHQFICDTSLDLSKAPNVNIIIDKTVIVLRPNELFSLHSSKVVGLFRISFRKDLQHWILGSGLVRKFNLVFNGDDDYIGFTHATDIHPINLQSHNQHNNPHHYLIIILYILTAVLIIGIIMLISNKVLL